MNDPVFPDTCPSEKNLPDVIYAGRNASRMSLADPEVPHDPRFPKKGATGIDIRWCAGFAYNLPAVIDIVRITIPVVRWQVAEIGQPIRL